jgi:hypothetical protein
MKNMTSFQRVILSVVTVVVVIVVGLAIWGMNLPA